MDSMQKEELVEMLRRVIKTKKVHYYWICPKGEDGAVHMMVERRIGPLRKAAKKARKAAKIKVSASGPVMMGSDGLVFVNEGRLQGKKVLKLFKTKIATDAEMKKIAPHIRSAQIYTEAEYEMLLASDPVLQAQAAEDATPPADNSFPDLYDAAVDELGLVEAALEDDPEYTSKLAGLSEHLASAQARYDDAPSDEAVSVRDKRIADAIRWVGQVRAAIPKLVELAWTTEQAHVRGLLGEFLSSIKGDESRRDEVAGLQSLWKAAIAKHGAGDLAEALALLERLEESIEEADANVDWDENEVDEATPVVSNSLFALASARLEWVQALGSARHELERYVRLVRGDPDVVEDPRFDEVIAPVLEGLLELVPLPGEAFSSGLLHAIDLSGEERDAVAREVLSEVSAYRERVDNHPHLVLLQGESEFGTFNVHDRLVSALDALENQLS